MVATVSLPRCPPNPGHRVLALVIAITRAVLGRSQWSPQMVGLVGGPRQYRHLRVGRAGLLGLLTALCVGAGMAALVCLASSLGLWLGIQASAYYATCGAGQRGASAGARTDVVEETTPQYTLSGSVEDGLPVWQSLEDWEQEERARVLAELIQAYAQALFRAATAEP
jgi:hypothetical protein